MEALIASAIGVLVAGGIYLLLRARTFPVILGLTLLSYATNLFVFSMGRLQMNAPPVGKSLKHVTDTATLQNYADPLPQALVLTAIVIGFGMSAFVVALAVKGMAELDTDHVDGEEPSS